MYPMAARAAWTIIAPSNLIALLLLLGLALCIFRRNSGRKFLLAGALLMVAGALFPAGKLLMAPLENRFPPLNQNLPARVDGIIVLGGGESPQLSFDRRQITLNDRSERLIYGAILAKEYPAARLVFSGGGGRPSEKLEADVASEFFARLGLTGARFTYESHALNSYENARLTFDLVKPKPEEKWLLVTSAFHMPRAMGAFRRAGWQITAFPVDYHTSNQGEDLWPRDISKRLAELDLGVHEWVGLATYRLLGRSGEFFPGP